MDNSNLITEASLFNLASVTKVFTATTILKLHEEGKLSIYDKVDKYIPGFINDNICHLYKAFAFRTDNSKMVINADHIWIRTAFSEVPMNDFILRFCFTVLKKVSISQRFYTVQ